MGVLEWGVPIYIVTKLNQNLMDSIERKAVVQCTSDLTSFLKHNLSCSGKLLEKGLITEAVYNYVLTAQGVSTLEKAARVVSCLADRIGESSQLFQELVQVLKEIDQWRSQDLRDGGAKTFAREARAQKF